MVDAMRRSDWKAARAYMKGRTDKAGADTIARLILPTVNAWIDIGARAQFPERHLLAVNSPTRPEPALSLPVAPLPTPATRPDPPPAPPAHTPPPPPPAPPPPATTT